MCARMPWTNCHQIETVIFDSWERSGGIPGEENRNFLAVRGSLAEPNISTKNVLIGVASGRKNQKLDPGPVNIHSMAGCGAHARSRRFLRVPCGDLPVFPEVPFSGPVAPRLDTFKAMRHALSHLPSEQPEEERQVQCWVVLSTA